MNPPNPSEYPNTSYFAEYLNFSKSDNLIELLLGQQNFIQKLCLSLSENELEFKYEASKWSIKELIGHMADSERIFAYRALCIARGETSPLPGFDENLYVENAHFQNCSPEQIWKYYQSGRTASLSLIQTLPEETLLKMGNANGKAVSANALFWMIAGHEKHHLKVINERYLPLLNKIL